MLNCKKHKTSQIIVFLTKRSVYERGAGFLSSRSRYRSGIFLRLCLRFRLLVFFSSGNGSKDPKTPGSDRLQLPSPAEMSSIFLTNETPMHGGWGYNNEKYKQWGEEGAGSWVYTGAAWKKQPGAGAAPKKIRSRSCKKYSVLPVLRRL